MYVAIRVLRTHLAVYHHIVSGGECGFRPVPGHSYKVCRKTCVEYTHIVAVDLKYCRPAALSLTVTGNTGIPASINGLQMVDGKSTSLIKSDTTVV